ncbi:DNA methylase [Anopheles sinensis]|uniref:DNA methylase n=1 Tax=Anopheles sinensis TaxID=74873 RepID=A0A084WI30_ANOSI|nr:DNA methylase [Anopheles sinensis]
MQIITTSSACLFSYHHRSSAFKCDQPSSIEVVAVRHRHAARGSISHGFSRPDQRSVFPAPPKRPDDELRDANPGTHNVRANVKETRLTTFPSAAPNVYLNPLPAVVLVVVGYNKHPFDASSCSGSTIRRMCKTIPAAEKHAVASCRAKCGT